MTAIDRTAYPRLAVQLSKKEVEAFYAPSPEEIAFVSGQGRGPSARLSQLVLLKTFQHLGYFPALRDIPENIIKFLRKVLELEADVQITLEAPRSLYRHHAAIREFLSVRAYSKEAELIAEAAIQTAVQTLHNPADLINAALEELIRQRFELPAFSHLDRLSQRIRTATHEAWYKDVFARLSLSEMQTLDRLPSLQDERSHSDFVRIKEPPGRPRLSEMRRLKDRLTWLSSLLNTEAILLGIPKARIIHFAKEARSLESHQILEMQAPHRYTLLLCLVHQAKIQCRDHLAEIFINRMQRVHDRAKVDLDLLQEKERQTREALIELLAQVTLKTQTTQDNGELGAGLRQLFDEYGGAEYLYQQCQALTVSHGDNTLPFLWPHYANHRKVVFDLLNLLELRSTSEDKSLLEALQFLREHPDAERLRPEVSLSFASLRWQKHILERDDQGERWFKRRAFELCVLSYLSQDLKSGDVCVLGSEQYADYREQLLSWEDCEPLIAEYCTALGIPATADGLVNLLYQELKSMLERVDARFPEDGQLSFNKRGELILKRLDKQAIPIGVTKLKRAIQERMPERNLLDILAFVERWTHYTRHFGPTSGSDNKLADALGRYIMTIFTYGANLGAAQAAKHSRGVFTQRMIAHINRQHIDTKNLEAASHDLINFFIRFDLPHFWGTGEAAVADGTLFSTYLNNIMAARHIRYGAYGGIAYHHVSDNYIALFSHFIGVGVYEAVYIIDGLLKNTSDIQPDILHADTHGQSLTVFGLSYLLGIQLMPRIRNWKDLNLYRPDKDGHYKHLDHLFDEAIDWTLISTHWKDMMRVILSIKVGKLLPSMLLRKLGNFSKRNRLYRAFRELGRVIRTLFLLRYISDKVLRRQIISVTTIIESFNHLINWLFFGGQGIIQHNDPVEQEKRIKYNEVLANAVMVMNVVDMTRILRQLDPQEYKITPQTLARLSPYMTDHIRRFGDYVIDLDTVPEDPELSLFVPDFEAKLNEESKED